MADQTSEFQELIANPEKIEAALAANKVERQKLQALKRAAAKFYPAAETVEG